MDDESVTALRDDGIDRRPGCRPAPALLASPGVEGKQRLTARGVDGMAMGANHTRGDTVIWVEPDGVLFAGDIAMKGMPAFVSSRSSLNHWLDSLNRLDALKPQVLVPSHGPLGDAGFIAGYRAYLTTVRTRVAALKAQGQTLEQVTQTVTAELKGNYPDAGRLAGAIRVAFAEAR